MSNTYEELIPQNTAPVGASYISVYDSTGKRVGGAGLQNLALPTSQKKRYSFLCVSDSHVKGSTETEDGTADTIRAFTYAENDPGIAFTTICGDVIDSGSEYYFEKIAGLISTYTTKPVYAITGNHESNQTSGYVTDEQTQAAFGHPLYYSFTHGDDVFIMLGEYSWTAYTPFADGELQFLYDTLEANRNKRCFVFFHIFSYDEGDSGQPNQSFYGSDIYSLSDANKTQKACFLSMLRHYKNVIWFHGHSHALFELQAVGEENTYSEKNGYRSVHISSLAHPADLIDGVRTKIEGASQGYVVDVYPDGIHLRGRDFVAGEFLPIASYWIDTVLQTVEDGTYTDPTGTVVT